MLDSITQKLDIVVSSFLPYPFIALLLVFLFNRSPGPAVSTDIGTHPSEPALTRLNAFSS